MKTTLLQLYLYFGLVLIKLFKLDYAVDGSTTVFGAPFSLVPSWFGFSTENVFRLIRR